MSDLGEFAKTLADKDGVAIMTVSDGWVFVFTETKLQELIETSKGKGYALVFVKSTANQPKN